MLTAEEYEKYKKKLADANKELATLEARRTQLQEYVRLTFGLTLDEARTEVARLKEELPRKEAEFETKYKEFNEKWESQLQKS